MQRTGPRGRSLRATAAWDLVVLQAAWDAELDRTGSEDAALAAVEQLMAVVPAGYSLIGELLEETPADPQGPADAQEHGRAGQLMAVCHLTGFAHLLAAARRGIERLFVGIVSHASCCSAGRPAP
jgi:hypothetical protein